MRYWRCGLQAPLSALGCGASFGGVLCSVSCYMSRVPLFVGPGILQASQLATRTLKQSCFIAVVVVLSAVFLLWRINGVLNVPSEFTWHACTLVCAHRLLQVSVFC
jgi:hypothetical protein